MKISGGIIALNEEPRIKNALLSMRPYVDEIVVVDGGSTDRTVEICKEIGAKVVYRKWSDDFGAQRNYMIDNSIGDWIFFLDADETISFYDKKYNLKRIIEKYPSCDGFKFVRSNFLDNKKTGSFADYDKQLRLFRRNGRYEKKIHEVPEHLTNVKEIDGKVCEILHYKDKDEQRKHLIYQKRLMDNYVSLLDKKPNRTEIEQKNLEALKRSQTKWLTWWQDAGGNLDDRSNPIVEEE